MRRKLKNDNWSLLDRKRLSINMMLNTIDCRMEVINKGLVLHFFEAKYLVSVRRNINVPKIAVKSVR